MRPLAAAAANRDIARLGAAWACASLGTWAFSILLALYAYERGGVGAVGAAAVVRMLPSAVAASYTAMLVDRHSRRTALIVCAVARSALMAAIGLAVAANAPLAAVLALAAAFTAAGTAQKPAQAALLPQFARTPDELAAANVCWGVIDNAGFLAGSLTAGALAGLVSLSAALTACMIPFLCAAAALRGMPVDARPKRLPEPAPGGLRAEMLGGVRTVRAHPELRLLLGVFGTCMLVQAMVDVLIVVAALEVLEIGRSGVGWLSATWGIGGLVGGAAAMVLLGRRRVASGVGLGCMLAGLPLIAIGAWPSPRTAIALMAVLGVGFALLEVALLTFTQRLAAGDVLGRVYGVQETVFVIATALGSLLAAALVGIFASAGALIVTGLVLPALAIALRRRLAMLQAGAPVPERAFELIRALPMFSPLPLATVENLALQAASERFPDGAAIVTQGDPGRDFYVIDDGTVEARDDGILLARLGERDFFGEIALLRDVPRTATVRAVTPVDVLVIGRDEFLSAVGTHPHSLHALESTVVARLTREPG